MKKMNKKGFTIVELVIVIAVIAILAAVLIPTFANVVKKANYTAALEEAKNSLTSDLVEANADYAKMPTIQAKIGSEDAKSNFAKVTLTATDKTKGYYAIDTTTKVATLLTDETATAQNGTDYYKKLADAFKGTYSANTYSVVIDGVTFSYNTQTGVWDPANF